MSRAANCIRARDDVSLAELRLECAGVLADALDLGADAADLLPCLTDAVSFRAYSDVTPALDRLAGLGLRLGVVSNWDVALPGVLDRLGLGDRFEVVVHSAGAGAQKPDRDPDPKVNLEYRFAQPEALRTPPELFAETQRPHSGCTCPAPAAMPRCASCSATSRASSASSIVLR